jgi:hypothetical protein
MTAMERENSISGKWKVESGKWKVESGKWKVNSVIRDK